MKRGLFVLILVISVSRELCSQNEATSFVGKWIEAGGKSKKNNAPPAAWVIAFAESTLTLVESSEPAIDGQQVRCNLDGTETRYATRGSTTIKEQSYECRLNKGKLEIKGTMTVSGMANMPALKFEIEQAWELSKDGKGLTLRERISAGTAEIRGVDSWMKPLSSARPIVQMIEEARCCSSWSRRALEKGIRELALDTSEKACGLIAFYKGKGFRFIEHVQWQETNYRSMIFAKCLLPAKRQAAAQNRHS